MTHLLPGGGVPRVHGARSPVPPRLPHFATPRSMHHLAAVAAGAYPPRRPPNAWSPGVLVPPGPGYWLVASETPVGWRRGCLAAGLVRGAVRHYCLGRCSALVVCARRSRPVRGGWGRCRMLCLPRFPLPAPRFLRCVWRAVLSGCPLPSLAGTPFHAVCAFRGLRPVALLVFPACPLCVRALALSQRPRPPPPPRVGVARAPRTVPVLNAGRAVPRGLCPSETASVPCSVWLVFGGGQPGPLSPLPGLGLCVWVLGVQGRALSHPRLPVLWGVRPGPTTHWLWVRGLRAWGPVTTSQRALLRAGFARCGGDTRAPGGGASCLGVGRPGSGALPPPTDRPFWRAAGAHYPLAVGAGGAGVKTCHNPTAHTPASWLCALWGRHKGASRGGGAPLAWVWGIQDRALSHPRPPVLWGVRRGPTTHWLWVRGVRAWGPVTNPTARALA